MDNLFLSIFTFKIQIMLNAFPPRFNFKLPSLLKEPTPRQPNGFPPPQQTSFPPPQQAGFLPPQQGGFLPAKQGGFLQPQQNGFLPPQKGGFPPPSPTTILANQPGQGNISPHQNKLANDQSARLGYMLQGNAKDVALKAINVVTSAREMRKAMKSAFWNVLKAPFKIWGVCSDICDGVRSLVGLERVKARNGFHPFNVSGLKKTDRKAIKEMKKGNAPPPDMV